MKNTENKGIRTYHYQASEDIFAKMETNDTPGIATTTIRQIKEAYNELMQDLILEAMEAY